VTFWKRPRTLILGGLIILAAWVIHAQSRDQARAGQEGVAAWVQACVRAAAAERDRAPAMGATEPIVAEAFAAWVRQAQPEGVAGDAALTVVPLRQEFFGDGSAATHRVDMALRGAQATLTVVWDGRGAHAIGFERSP
jgi:hypothetical protein